MTDGVLRERAERHLLRLLSKHASWWGPTGPGGMADPQSVEGEQRGRFEDAIETYLALDLLSAGAAEDWRSRWGVDEPSMVVAPGERPVPDPDVRRRAERLLEARLAAIRPPREQPTEEDAESLRAPLSDFMAAMTAAGICCAGGFGEWERWERRLHDRLGVPESVERARRAAFEELVRVIPGPGELHAGVRVTTVELYGDGVAVRWQRIGERRPPLPRPELEIADDRGTEYVHSGGGGSGGGGSPDVLVAFGHARFTPAVPEEARRLDIHADGELFGVDLGAGHG